VTVLRPAFKRAVTDEQKVWHILQQEASKKGTAESGVVVSTCNPSYSGSRGRRIASSRPVWAKLMRPNLENKKIKTKAQGEYK
jgi:hypothetical protein